ncbi:MAG TPA: PspC domain-containing protein, partial [Baekduia sp.]|nr:PspC domain-containing protein [Baekduia sp.]
MTPLTRATHGRWLGGVCAGIARARGIPAAWVRGAFALAALAGGIGVLAYVACWLIVPAEGDEDGSAGPRAIVTLVLAGAGAVGLVTLGALAAAATIFGFGWVVVAVAAVVLIAALSSGRRLGPGWALLPVAALVLPSVALAAAGVHVAPQTGDQRFAPATAADLPAGGYRTGLGTMVVDLRHTALPARGRVPLKVEGGVRRTIVALPHDRCVSVSVRYHVRSFAARAATVLLGRSDTVFDDVVVFGHTGYGHRGTVSGGDPSGGPELTIDFTSAGGSLYVRDYPDAVDPTSEPDWPYALGRPAAAAVHPGMSRT